MIKIAVLSDSHVGDHSPGVPDAIWELVDAADAVVHLGDFTDIGLAAELQQRKTLYAVSGNSDTYAIRHAFPSVRTVEFEGVKAVLMHQFAGPWAAAEQRALKYRAAGASLILFGHTHKPENAVIGGVRILNPGSCGDGRRFRGTLTAGMLQIDAATVSWELWPLGREVLV